MFKYFFYILISLIILSMILKKNNNTYGDNLDLNKNGIIVIKNILNDNDINFLLNNEPKVNHNYITNNIYISNMIKNKIGNNYYFHDYLFYIKKSKLHTCHRDGNSKYYNKNLNYPSYTILFYLSQMDKCLDVIINSHKKYKKLYITDNTTSIICNKGDAILFDAGLIHAGSFNKFDNYPRIQMKLSHIDDFKIINFYNNYYSILNKDNNLNNNIKKIHKHISCQMPFLNDLFYKEINNYVINNKKSFLEKLYWKFIYGNKNYFN